MRKFWLVLPVIALFPHSAAALTMNKLTGRWCGDSLDYVFSSKRLTVYFHNGSNRVLMVKNVTPDGEGIKVWWIGPPKPDGTDNATIFDLDDGVLVQKANTGGDKGPRREFRRC
jgi:hypothetical protein